MTFDQHPHHRLTPGASPRKSVSATARWLRRVATALLAGAAFLIWIATLPALLGHSGLSWRIDECGAPGYRDPITGQAAHRRTICRPTTADWRP